MSKELIEQARNCNHAHEMIRVGQATPREELERQIMSSLVPKNEREHWAAREIGSLREQLAHQWQPIDTAPKDGTVILISNGKGAWVAKYKDVYQSGFKPNNPWFSLMLNKDHIPKRLRFGAPTHWMPLPSAEAIEKGGV